jgi:hypothetical protein
LLQQALHQNWILHKAIQAYSRNTAGTHTETHIHTYTLVNSTKSERVEGMVVVKEEGKAKEEEDLQAEPRRRNKS